MSTTLKCSKCGQEKDSSSFAKNKSRRSGYNSYCKDCAKDNYYSKAEYKSSKALSNRKSALKRKYGLTLEDYQLMWDNQGGVCAICGQPEIGKLLSVDHNHSTGKIRDLLCDRCNKGIGQAKEDLDIICNMIEYLLREEDCLDGLELMKVDLKGQCPRNGKTRLYSYAEEMKRQYGITIEQYNALSLKQNDKCAICGSSDKLVIDHNHSNGKARGLICNSCNATLGSVRDDPETLIKYERYLLRWQYNER